LSVEVDAVASSRRHRHDRHGVGEKHGKLYVNFSWRGVPCREYVNDDDTPDNRKKWETRCALIRAQIKAGTFDYRTSFPNGTKLAVFYPDSVPATDWTVPAWLKHWHALRSPFRADGSLIEGADIHPTTWLHDESAIKKMISALGHHRLADLTTAHCEAWRRSLLDGSFSGKTVLNYVGLLHKAMADAVEQKLLASNPVPQLRAARRKSKRVKKNSKPLSADEVRAFLSALPERVEMSDGAFVSRSTLRDLYGLWFRTGCRSNEIVALRFDWVSPGRQTMEVRRGRSPRRGGLEASPKTGEREVVGDYDPDIWALLARRKRESLTTGKRDFVFTDSRGRPLSQEWLGKRVWNPTIEAIGLSPRGQYNVKDTFITLALSAGEDPGWVAEVCGTSEQMIFEHYRTWMPKLRRGHGKQLIGMLGLGPRFRPKVSPKGLPKKAKRR
jgi:integrase